jgi:hypothetical protein
MPPQIGELAGVTVNGPTLKLRRPIPKKHSTKERMTKVMRSSATPTMALVSALFALSNFALSPPALIHWIAPHKNMITNTIAPTVNSSDTTAGTKFEKKVTPSAPEPMMGLYISVPPCAK